jgi:hypothetical protein
MDVSESYKLGAELAADLMGQFIMFELADVPMFAMPPKEIALIASIDEIGEYLVRNDSARELVGMLVREFKGRKQVDCPTVMILRACLDMYGIPINYVSSFEELGIPGKFLPMGYGGSA